MREILYYIKSRIFDSRVNVLYALLVLFAVILTSRLFVLQIIRGADYQSNYNLRIERTETIEATRGNIYDVNGKLLAYNELAYAVTIEDSGTYESAAKRNESINADLNDVIRVLEKNGDVVDTTFGVEMLSDGTFSFVDSGTNLQRFRADIFGHASIKDLVYNAKLGINESEATPDEIMGYLCGDFRYNISDKYDKATRYKIAIIRYKMGLNSYQKYISTIISNDVSDESVAYVMENANELEGITVEEKPIRRYENAKCFSNIIGYTGTISPEEYGQLSKEDDSYTLNDVIGKSGIEQYLNSHLVGKKGTTTIYVDSLGNLIDTAEYTEPVAGGDVYLSIDSDLQVNVYNLLEQEIAGILYSKIENTKEYSESGRSDDIIIPITDVYYALLDNNLIKTSRLYSPNANSLEKDVANSMDRKKTESINKLELQLQSGNTAYKDLTNEFQNYSTYVVRMLKRIGVIDESKIENSNETQMAWVSEELPLGDYLRFLIDKGWIDISSYMKESKYVDSNEMYMELVNYIVETLEDDNDFKQLCAKFAILEDQIGGEKLCALLYDHEILEMDEESRRSLLNGTKNPYDFMKEKIKALEITPGQLGLDPCSGSAVIINPQSGQVLACVTYPGYDSNRLANSVDTSYFAYLNASNSSPLYNHATQERTAPGSTFKPITATAGLAEGIIDPSTQIHDDGVFEEVDNRPQCWYYPGSHGLINVSEAIRDSCNYFFYQMGYDLAGNENYSDYRGIEKIANYASLYGLDEKTGIEIEESKPSIATEYPVMAAIGQSNHNFTTISLARYVSAVANNGNVYDLTLLDHINDNEGNLVENYAPTLRNQINILTANQWAAIHSGMRMVVEELDIFDGFPVEVAGKTGTAQQSKSRPNHALFIGYAPYNNPRIAVAARISFGYTSHNAADLCKNIMGVYFDVEEYEDSVNGVANNITTTNRFAD